jgi:hypothetical protein
MAFEPQQFNARWEQGLDLMQEVFLLNLAGAQALVAHQVDIARAVLAEQRAAGADTAAPPPGVWAAIPKVAATGAAATEEWLDRYRSVIARSMRLVESRSAQAQVLLRRFEADLLDGIAGEPTSPVLGPVARSPGRSGPPDQRLAA